MMFLLCTTQVNSNGVLSFRNSFTSPTPQPFPLGTNDIIIAPFWAGINYVDSGTVYFRFSTDPDIISEIQSVVLTSFGTEYVPSLLFIATWNFVVDRNAQSNRAVCKVPFYVKV